MSTFLKACLSQRFVEAVYTSAIWLLTGLVTFSFYVALSFSVQLFSDRVQTHGSLGSAQKQVLFSQSECDIHRVVHEFLKSSGPGTYLSRRLDSCSPSLFVSMPRSFLGEDKTRVEERGLLFIVVLLLPFLVFRLLLFNALLCEALDLFDRPVVHFVEGELVVDVLQYPVVCFLA